MKSGFLLSNNPKISLLSEQPPESDHSLGHRKYKYEDFDFERNIGTGNFSNVWYVTLKSDPLSAFAIKSYNIHTVTAREQHVFVRQERAALLRLNSPGHPNVIRLVDTFRDELYVYLIYECADGGELWDLVKHCGTIYDDLAREFILQVVDALEYVHSKGLVHRDLKCENVVIAGETLKLIDFGSSKDAGLCGPELEAPPERRARNPRLLRKSHRFENYVGTPNFMDPQSTCNRDSGFRRDLWGLGCLIYQMLCGRPPFFGSTEYFVLKRVREFDLVFPPCLDPLARDLILRLLVPEPERRLSLQGVRAHPFLAAPRRVSFASVERECREVREVCSKIGELLLELVERRSSETRREFREQFERHMRALERLGSERNRHEMDRLRDLMLWSLAATTSEIASETREADRWLS